MFCHFVDDFFVVVRKVAYLENLKRMMQDSSTLDFTCEIEENKSILFLDTDFKKARGLLVTSVHMNHRSIALVKYKKIGKKFVPESII